jgi:hypothetical protein
MDPSWKKSFILLALRVLLNVALVVRTGVDDVSVAIDEF